MGKGFAHRAQISLVHDGLMKKGEERMCFELTELLSVWFDGKSSFFFNKLKM